MAGWHYLVDGNAHGPIPGPQLRALLMEGTLGADTLLWTSGMTGWRKASETSMLRTASVQPPQAQITPEPDLTPPDPAVAESAGPEFFSGPPASKNPDWFYVYDGEPRGPIPEDELRRLVSQGVFDLDTLVWTEELPTWQKLLETGRFEPPLAPPPGGDTAPPTISTVAEELPVTVLSVKALPVALDLRVGEVLRDSLRTLWARVGTWLFLGVVYLALTLPLTMAATSLDSIPAQYIIPVQYMARLVVLAIAMLLQVIIIFGAFQTHHGQRFHLGKAVLRGFQRFLPVLGILSLLILATAIGILVFVVLVGLFLGFFSHGFALGSAISRGFLAVGIILCGLVFAARTFVAIPACIVDASPPFVSLSRSFHLTKIHSSTVVALLLLAVIPFFLAMAAVLATLSLTPSLRLALADSTMGVVVELVLMPFRWLPAAFFWIVMATTYAKLQAPSGLPAAKVAKAFG